MLAHMMRRRSRRHALAAAAVSFSFRYRLKRNCIEEEKRGRLRTMAGNSQLFLSLFSYSLKAKTLDDEAG